MEATIEAAEAHVKALEAELADPVLYKERGAEIPLRLAALDAARAEVERLYTRWQELESILERREPQ
jgi:ATP-binding cassette subfamily F protein uup